MFHEALDKRRQELSDGQHRRPPMKTCSVDPKVFPSIMRSVASTSVLSLPSINKKSCGCSAVAKQIPKRQGEMAIIFQDRLGPSSTAVPPVSDSGSAVLFPGGKEKKTQNSQKSESAGSPLLKGETRSLISGDFGSLIFMH